MAITLKDISKQAGISLGVASTVLNNAKTNIRVSPATRKRVLEIAKLLNYRPDLMARGLRNKRTGLLGVVTPRIDWGHWPGVLQGIEDACEKVDYNVILCTTDEDSDIEAKKLQLLIDKGVDGILAVPAWETRNIALYDRILKSSHPLVVMMRNLHLPNCPFVCVNPRKMGQLAAEHLVTLGHRHVVLLGQFSSEYRSGFVETALDMGVSLKNIVECSFGESNVSAGKRHTQKLLEQKVRFTAIHGTDDYVSIGAIQACQDAGLNVPKDVSVLGANDDYDVATLFRPALTTIGQPKAPQGQAASEMLLEMVTGKPGRDILLEPYFKPGESTAKAIRMD